MGKENARITPNWEDFLEEWSRKLTRRVKVSEQVGLFFWLPKIS